MARDFVRKIPFVVLTLILLLGAGGCVRRYGRNSECKWPAETVHHAANARHLSADAEFAEDLAIRYADSHFGPRSPNPSEKYGPERDRCMGDLFEKVAEEHGVAVEQVSNSLGRNRGYIDLAEILSFAMIYFFVAIVIARISWRQYSPEEHGWTPGMIMALFLSVVVAGAGLLLGEVWCGIAETYRIGNSHMSYRFDRLVWARYRAEFFLGLLVVFWLVVVATARNLRSQFSGGT